MDQLERIAHMEKILDEVTAVVASLSDALSRYHAIQNALGELTDYYDSGLWRRDFDDDGAGKLPKNLKRGVLSEDAVYNLLSDVDVLNRQLKNGG